MSPKIIQVPDFGNIEFPDEMSDEQIGAVLSKSHFGPPDKPQGPSAMEAFGRGAAQGATINFGDEAQGLVQAGLGRVLPEGAGGFGPDHRSSFTEDYRQQRDVARGENDAAREAHKGSYLGGALLGGTAPALAAGGASGAARGLSIGQKLLRAGAAGGAFGGAAGAGGSDADTAGGVAKDTALGAGTGALLSAGMAAAGSAARPLGDKLRDASTNIGRRFLSGTQSSLSSAKPLTGEAVEEAFRQGAIRPLSTVSSAAEKLAAARGSVGATYSQIVKELEDAGVTGSNVQALASKYAAKAVGVDANTMQPAVSGAYYGTARKLLLKPTDAEGNLALSQQENLKRSLQDKATSAYRRVQSTELGDAYKDTASMMRQGTEDAIDAQSAKAPDAAARFAPVKQQLSRLIPASDAADAAAARFARNHLIGLKELGMGAGNIPKTAAAVLLKGRGTSTAAWLARALGNGADQIPESTMLTEQAALAAALQKHLQQTGSQNVP